MSSPIVQLFSEDPSVRTGISLEFGHPVVDDGKWVPYRLILESGDRRQVLEEPDGGTIGRCALGLEPRNEVEILTRGVSGLLAGERERFTFEPQEPNWSLEIAKAPEGWTVVCWIDAGNQLTDHYTWDAIGVRYFTNQANLEAFHRALQAQRATR